MSDEAIDGAEELARLLTELKAQGHVQEPQAGVFQQSQQGADIMDGPIANEPPPGSTVTGPASIDVTGAATKLGPTPIEPVESVEPEVEA
jgi:hypothetical protein